MGIETETDGDIGNGTDTEVGIKLEIGMGMIPGVDESVLPGWLCPGVVV